LSSLHLGALGKETVLTRHSRGRDFSGFRRHGFDINLLRIPPR
jgi:hypothetical protein